MFYYLLIAFQAFCIFHVYKIRNDSYWYFVIFFVPIIGATVYVFSQVINKNNLISIGEKITTIFDPNKEVRTLKKKLSLSDTFQNNINLANTYKNNNDFTNAVLYYEKALTGRFKNNSYTLNEALKCYYQINKYDKVIDYASKINIDQSFSDSIFIYAIALEKCGYFENAEVQFRKTNVRYSNYAERLELSKFLIRRNNKEDAKIVLNEIISEINNMIDTNKRKYKIIYKESKSLFIGI